MSAVHNIPRLPVLDLSRFEAGAGERRAFVEELRHVSRDVGFFYLAGHGIDQELIQRTLGVTRCFFDLPEADKLAIEMIPSPHFRGYTRPGREFTRGEPDWREQIDVGAERPALAPEAIEEPWHRLQGPNQWPDALPDLKPALLAYQEAVTALAIRVLKAFAAALEQPDDVFEPIHTPWPNQLTKIIRYPGRGANESDQGVGPHKDGGFVTILLQDNVAGLQVEGESGWIDAPPVAGTFIVNIGEILEIASNGFLRATLHRVVSPPAGGDRLSIGFFSRRPSRRARSATRSAAASGGIFARPDTGSAQPPVQRSWAQRAEGPVAFASRCRAAPLPRSARLDQAATRTALRLLIVIWECVRIAIPGKHPSWGSS